ncbi:uncharacterized protein DS421_1g18370 [Arachis hypogaea]|nr:uncharacterized protein DS421_1g18370 [Arachis hypogaea]
MSQESPTYHGVSPNDLAELETADLMEALVWTEKALRDRLEMTEAELRQAKLSTVIAKVNERIWLHEVACYHQLESRLRVELEQRKMTIRQLDDKANQLRGIIVDLRQLEWQQMTPWHELEGRLEVVGIKLGLLARQLYGQAPLTGDGSKDQEPAEQSGDDVRGI